MKNKAARKSALNQIIKSAWPRQKKDDKTPEQKIRESWNNLVFRNDKYKSEEWYGNPALVEEFVMTPQEKDQLIQLWQETVDYGNAGLAKFERLSEILRSKIVSHPILEGVDISSAFRDHRDLRD